MTDPKPTGLVRSALMRPTQWLGEHAIPSQGAFCGICEGQEWVGVEDGWCCTTCRPQAAACVGGRYVNTGSVGHG